MSDEKQHSGGMPPALGLNIQPAAQPAQPSLGFSTAPTPLVPPPTHSLVQQQLGECLVSSIISGADTASLLSLNISESLFTEAELRLYRAFTRHVRQYGAIPHMDTFLRDNGLRSLPTAPEKPAYYVDKLRNRHIQNGGAQVLTAFAEAFKPGSTKNPNQALDNALRALMDIKRCAMSNGLYDMRELGDRIVPAYQQKVLGTSTAILTGWDYFDRMSGGVQAGDILSIVGRPAAGKTWLNLKMALHPWMTQHKRTLFVTTEMVREQIDDRIAAMTAQLPVRNLSTGRLATGQIAKLQGRMQELATAEAPLWLLDANQMNATVEDLWSIASMLDIEFLVIDGAYLLAHRDKKLDRFTRVAENCRMLKSDIAAGLNIPLAASWQFSREMAKKKNAKGKKGGDEKAGLEDIGFSDEIGQISSIVLGMLDADSVETLQRRKIDVMKGRGGELGHWYVNWDFNQMDFGEWIAPSHEQLKFV